jgi:hypothetical protein
MFPDPLTRGEIAHIMRPMLARCDAAGRAYVIELVMASAKPDVPRPSNETIKTLTDDIAHALHKLGPETVTPVAC